MKVLFPPKAVSKLTRMNASTRPQMFSIFASGSRDTPATMLDTTLVVAVKPCAAKDEVT